MVQIIPTETYLKHVEERATGNRRQEYERRIKAFEANPRDPWLKNKPLHGEHRGLREIRVGGSHRIIFRELGDDRYQFMAFGHKNQLFRKYKGKHY